MHPNVCIDCRSTLGPAVALKAARVQFADLMQPCVPAAPFLQILLWVSAFVSMLLDNIPYTITMGECSFTCLFFRKGWGGLGSGGERRKRRGAKGDGGTPSLPTCPCPFLLLW